MSEINFRFIGWVFEENHDKVWTSFETENQLFCAWGRRGKKMQFKKHRSYLEICKVEAKKKRDYSVVDKFKLFSVFPEFESQVAEQLVMKMLSGDVR